MKQIHKATDHITDSTQKILETITTYVDLGGKFSTSKLINKNIVSDIKEKKSVKKPKKEEKQKTQHNNNDQVEIKQTYILDKFNDYKPQNNKIYNDVDDLQPPELIRQTAIIHEGVEDDSDDSQSVNTEQDQIVADSDNEEETESKLELIGDLKRLDDGDYRFQVIVNGNIIKFGDSHLPDVESLRNRFSSRKIQIIISKIKRNFSINDNDDIHTAEFWNYKVYLSCDYKKEYNRLREIYN